MFRLYWKLTHIAFVLMTILAALAMLPVVIIFLLFANAIDPYIAKLERRLGRKRPLDLAALDREYGPEREL